MKRHGLGIVSDGMTKLANAKGPPHAKDVDTLQQTGLATAVSANQKVNAWTRGEVHSLEVAQAMERETFDRHQTGTTIMPVAPGEGTTCRHLKGASA